MIHLNHRFCVHPLTTVNPEAQVVQPQLPSRVSSHLMHQNNKDPLSNMASLSDDGDPDFSLTGHPNGRIGGSAFVATHPVLHQSDRAHSQEGDGGSGGGSDSKAAIAAAARKKVSGRVCAECSATTTPQWREGPAGEDASETMCSPVHTHIFLSISIGVWTSFSRQGLYKHLD